MDACTSGSAIQLVGLAFTFLLAVIWLDMFWVRIPQELHNGDFPGALKKRGWLNAFVGVGAAGAAVLLLIWINRCAHGGF
jgi:hypothetical protein